MDNREPILLLIRQAIEDLGEGIIDVMQEFKWVQTQGLSPVGTRGVLLRTLQRVAQAVTDTDCAFLRRVNVDNSLELLPDVEPFWRPGRPEVGAVPRIKRPGTGVSGWVVKERHGQPVLIRDVRDSRENPFCATAHRLSIEHSTGEEQRFLAFIGSEVCIPLVVEGRTLAVIVAVRGTPFAPAEAQEVRHRLERWARFLIPLYAIATTVGDVGDQEDRLSGLVQVMPRIAASPDDETFYRRMATVLTCDKGLKWHRAMVFRFRRPYPADAACVMAIGGDGDPERSGVQNDLSGQIGSLGGYLDSCDLPDFGLDDTLYKRVRDRNQGHIRPWVVPGDAVAAFEPLVKIFEGRAPVQAGANGVLKLPSDHPLLSAVRAGEPDAFRECAEACAGWVVPLFHPAPSGAGPTARAGVPLGFVLLDRPYVHPCDLPKSLPLTRLVCDLFAGLLAARAEAAGTDPAPRTVAAPS